MVGVGVVNMVHVYCNDNVKDNLLNFFYVKVRTLQFVGA